MISAVMGSISLYLGHSERFKYCGDDLDLSFSVLVSSLIVKRVLVTREIQWTEA